MWFSYILHTESVDAERRVHHCDVDVPAGASSSLRDDCSNEKFIQLKLLSTVFALIPTLSHFKSSANVNYTSKSAHLGSVETVEIHQRISSSRYVMDGVFHIQSLYVFWVDLTATWPHKSVNASHLWSFLLPQCNMSVTLTGCSHMDHNSSVRWKSFWLEILTSLFTWMLNKINVCLHAPKHLIRI